MTSTEQVRGILDALKIQYPDCECALHYEKDYELLISVRLSAQCTDKRVNQVTPALFAAYPTLESFAAASIDSIEDLIRSCGFYHHKAADIIAACRMLLQQFNGKIPDTMEELLQIPGVGRKTANLLLGDLYGKEAYVCDTHCIRICGLLGLTNGSKNPDKVEMQLRKIIPPAESSAFCHRLVEHGRAVCIARRPNCPGCVLAPFCKHACDAE